jgi:hypothetical protein
MGIPAPLEWALKIVVSYFLDWCYQKMKMYRRLKKNRRERREITKRIIDVLEVAETEADKRAALDNIVRSGF